MSIKEKIQNYLEYKGVTPTAAERELGWGVGAFTKAKSITAERAKEFLLLYNDLSAEWLFRDEGEMLKGKSSASIEKEVEKEFVVCVDENGYLKIKK